MSLALCIPAYNAEHFLPGLLADAAGQSQRFDEIWVHDDASTDNTAGVAQAFGAKVIRSDRNVGCSMGKHRMLLATGCDLVHFHDADDGLKEDFVATMLAAMEPKTDVLLSGYEYREHASGELLAQRVFDDAVLREDPVAFTISQPINAICGVYRVAAIKAAGGYQIPDSQLYNEDQAFHCRLARAGLHFRALDSIHVVNYRVRDSMSGAAHLECVAAQFEVMAQAAADSPSRYFPAIAARLWQIGAVAASLNGWAVADQAVLLASRLDGRGPGEGHPAYRWLARRAPKIAIRLRNWAITLLGKRPLDGAA